MKVYTMFCFAVVKEGDVRDITLQCNVCACVSIVIAYCACNEHVQQQSPAPSTHIHTRATIIVMANRRRNLCVFCKGVTSLVCVVRNITDPVFWSSTYNMSRNQFLNPSLFSVTLFIAEA